MNFTFHTPQHFTHYLGQSIHRKCTTASLNDSSAQAYQSHINLIVVIQFPISPPCTYGDLIQHSHHSALT